MKTLELSDHQQVLLFHIISEKIRDFESAENSRRNHADLVQLKDLQAALLSATAQIMHRDQDDDDDHWAQITRLRLANRRRATGAL